MIPVMVSIWSWYKEEKPFLSAVLRGVATAIALPMVVFFLCEFLAPYELFENQLDVNATLQEKLRKSSDGQNKRKTKWQSEIKDKRHKLADYAIELYKLQMESVQPTFVPNADFLGRYKNVSDKITGCLDGIDESLSIKFGEATPSYEYNFGNIKPETVKPILWHAIQAQRDALQEILEELRTKQ